MLVSEPRMLMGNNAPATAIKIPKSICEITGVRHTDGVA